MLLISTSVSSCNDPDQPAATDTASVIETTSSVKQKDSIVDEKTPHQKNTDTQNKHEITIKKPATGTPKPALKLSIEDIEDTLETEDVGTDFDQYIDLYDVHQTQILTRKQKDDGIKLSGKLFTDREMLDTGEYLYSVDGVQLNIEGSFK